MNQQVVQVKRDMEWHDAIAKYLPQVKTQPHGDPRSIIEWLFERVVVKDSAMHIADTLKESEIEVTVDESFYAEVQRRHPFPPTFMRPAK